MLNPSPLSSKKRHAQFVRKDDDDDDASASQKAARATQKAARATIQEPLGMSHVGYFVRSGQLEDSIETFFSENKKRSAVLNGPEDDDINNVRIGQEMPILPHVIPQVILKLTLGLPKYDGKSMLESLEKLMTYGHWENQIVRTITSMLIFLERKQKDGWDGFNDEINLYDALSSKILHIIGVTNDERYDELAERAMNIGLKNMSETLYSRLSKNESLKALACSNPNALFRLLSDSQIGVFRGRTDMVMSTYLIALKKQGEEHGTNNGTLWVTTSPYDMFLALQRVDPDTTNRAFYDREAGGALVAWTKVSCEPPVRASIMLSFMLDLQKLYYLELGRRHADYITSLEPSLATLHSKCEEEEDGSVSEMPDTLQPRHWDNEDMSDTEIIRRDALLRRWQRYQGTTS